MSKWAKIAKNENVAIVVSYTFCVDIITYSNLIDIYEVFLLLMNLYYTL